MFIHILISYSLLPLYYLLILYHMTEFDNISPIIECAQYFSSVAHIREYYSFYQIGHLANVHHITCN